MLQRKGFKMKTAIIFVTEVSKFDTKPMFFPSYFGLCINSGSIGNICISLIPGIPFLCCVLSRAWDEFIKENIKFNTDY